MANYNISTRYSLTDGVSGPAARINSSLGRMGSSASNATALLKGMSIAIPVVTAIGKGVIESLKTFNDYEYQMAKVKAVTGATASEMALMSDRARELGSTTMFSATEVGKGMENLTRAGFSATEAIESIDDALVFAQANAISMDSATTILSKTMRTFNIDAKNANTVVDVFSNTARKHNTNVEEMYEAYKQAGSIANTFGADVFETATAIGILADKGVEGGRAGTHLKGILTRLSSPTKEARKWISKLGLSITDSNGNMRDFSDILADMRKALDGTSDSYKLMAEKAIFGQIAIGSGDILLKTATDTYAKYEQEIRNSQGATEDMATTMNDTLKGRVNEVKSAFEELKITIGEISAPAAKEGLSGLATILRNMAQGAKDTAEGMGYVVENIQEGLGVDPNKEPAPTMADVKQDILKKRYGGKTPFQNWLEGQRERREQRKKREQSYIGLPSVIDMFPTKTDSLLESTLKGGESFKEITRSAKSKPKNDYDFTMDRNPLRRYRTLKSRGELPSQKERKKELDIKHNIDINLNVKGSVDASLENAKIPDNVLQKMGTEMANKISMEISAMGGAS